MKGKPAKRKLVRDSSRLPFLTGKQLSARRARIVARLSTVVAKLKEIEAQADFIAGDAAVLLRRTKALAEHTRGKVQNLLT